MSDMFYYRCLYANCFCYFQGQRGISFGGDTDGQYGIRHQRFEIASFPSNGEGCEHKTSAANASSYGIGCRKNALQLDGSIHVPLPQRPSGAVHLCPLQNH